MGRGLRPRAQWLPSDRMSVAVRLGTESLLFTCRITWNVGRYPRNTHRLIPDGVEMPEAAVVPISFATAHLSFHPRHAPTRRNRPYSGRGGGVGLAAVQLASQTGATVIAVASGTQRRSRLLELGADHVVDRAEHNIVDRVRQYTPGVPVLTSSSIRWGRRCLLRFLHLPRKDVSSSSVMRAGSLTVDLWSPMQSNQTLMGVFMGPLLQGLACGPVWTTCCRL